MTAPRDLTRRAALGWATLVLVASLAAGAAVGPGELEARFHGAARRHGAWWVDLATRPLETLRAIPAKLGPEAGAASVPLAASGAGPALIGRLLPGHDLLALRLSAALFAALLAWVLSRLAGDLAGSTGALLAPALFFLVPSAFDAALRSGVDLPAAALWLGVLLAHLRGLRSRDRRERLRRGLVAGILFGAAVATRREAWALLPLLLVHYLLVRSRGGLRALHPSPDAPPPHPAGRGPLRSLLGGLPASLPAMLVLGPLVFVATSPWIWSDPVHRLLAAARATLGSTPFVHLGTVVAQGRPPWHAPLLAALLLPPGTVLLLQLAGLAHTGRRLVLGWRGEAAASFGEELLLLLGALVPLALAATGVTPAAAGIGPVLPSLAVLAILGARALATAARTAWPANAAKLALATCLLALYPALRATVRTFPHGADAWSEWVGGAPGAASIGLPRLTAGAGAALLDEIGERAAGGQRIWWPTLPAETLEALRAAGRLRADLRIAASPEEADLAVVEHDDARRDLEFQVWTAFRTNRPVAGARLDEVPMATVYARPGAWR